MPNHELHPNKNILDPNKIPEEVWTEWSESFRCASQSDPEILTQVLEQDATNMIATADTYVQRMLADPTTIDGTEPPGDEASRSLDPLNGMTLVSEAVHLEFGEVGMVHGLIADVHPNEAVRAAARQQMQRLQEYYDGLIASPKVQAAFDKIDPTQLDEDDKQRYDFYTKLMNDSKNATIANDEQGGGAEQLRAKLDRAATEFKDTTIKLATLELSEEDLASLPSDYERRIAVSRGNGTVTVVLDESTATYLQQAGSSELGRKAFEGFFGAVVENNDQNIRDMVAARAGLAGLQNTTWTDMKVEGLTIGTVPDLVRFRNSIAPTIFSDYHTAIAKLQELRAAEGKVGPMEEWDVEHYKQKLLDQSSGEGLKFTFNNSLKGMLEFAEGFFGIQIDKLDDAPSWAEGVNGYAVRDKNGEILGSFFLDPFTRPGKRANGANYSLSYGRRDKTGKTAHLPLSVSVLNLAKLTEENQDPELSQRQVEVMAHEILGHLMHVTFARTIGPEFGGDKITKDLLEVASQTMEYVARDPAVLLMLTDTVIPDENKRAFIHSRTEAQRHVSAIDTMRKLRVSTLDLLLHGENVPFDKAIQQVNALAEPVISNSLFRRRQVQLGNSYAGWYLSGYQVSDVYAQANVKRIQSHGYGMNSLGEEFRKVLALGGGPSAITEMMNFGKRGIVTQPAGGAAVAGSTSLQMPS